MPKFSEEAAKRAALKLANMFTSNKLNKGVGVALSVNRRVVIDRFVVLGSGALYNIIGRDELTTEELLKVQNFQPIILNTAAKQVTVAATVEVYAHDPEDTFLLLPECQPVFFMGQLSDADFAFS